MLTSPFRTRLAQGLLALLVATGGAWAEDGPPVDSRVEGVIFDSKGIPVPGCRVIARTTDGRDIYVGPPSDEEGKYFVAVPSGRSYVIVALVSPTGGRLAWPEDAPLAAGTARNLELPMAMGPTPRKGGKEIGGVERLHLSFVEDPAHVNHGYVEAGGTFVDYDSRDLTLGQALVAFAPRRVPQVEVGARGGFGTIEFSNTDDSGVTDIDLWGKVHFFRSGTTRMDMGGGVLVTLPTGDHEAGLGHDAIQSKLFMAMSYSLPTAAIVGHMGMRVTGDGSTLGFPLEGTMSPTMGIGIVAPASPTLSLVIEGLYEGERFEGFGEDARATFGFNWQINRRGLLRAVTALGLIDEAPDAEIRVSYGFKF